MGYRVLVERGFTRGKVGVSGQILTMILAQLEKPGLLKIFLMVHVAASSNQHAVIMLLRAILA